MPSGRWAHPAGSTVIPERRLGTVREVIPMGDETEGRGEGCNELGWRQLGTRCREELQGGTCGSVASGDQKGTLRGGS